MDGNEAGLLHGARTLAGDGVRMLRTRLELLAIEVQAEKAILAQQLVASAAVLFLASFGTLMVILWAVLSLPEGDRQAALGAVGIAFLVAGAAVASWLKYGGARRAPLHATIAVLEDDERALRGTRV